MTFSVEKSHRCVVEVTIVPPAENRGRRRGATIFGASVKETIENPGGDVIYCTSESAV